MLESYSSKYFQKSFESWFTKKGGDDFMLFVTAYSLDPLYKMSGLILRSGKYDMFIDALNHAADKYLEWSKVAKENNIQEAKKEVKVNSLVEAFFGNNDYHFDQYVELEFEFKILPNEDKQPDVLLIIRSGDLVSVTNEYIDSKGFAIVFSSYEEISSFLKSISKESIQNYKPKHKNDLFKD